MNLANLLREWSGDVGRDVARSVSLHEWAILEGFNYNTMNILATLLRRGFEGVECDAV